MAAPASTPFVKTLRLDRGWQLARSETGPWLPAAVPGTVAQALAAAGQLDPLHPVPLDGETFWYRLVLENPPERAVLRCDGLATVAEVFVDGVSVLKSENMFHAHRVPLSGLKPGSVLTLRFDALTPWCEAKKGRARWRPLSVKPSSLRWARTTQLGRSAWGLQLHTVGPWRELALDTVERELEAKLHASLDGDTGVLTATLRVAGTHATLRCAGHETALQSSGGAFTGTLKVPGVAKWWPHTHGAPALHEVSLTLDGETVSLGHTGFRQLEGSPETGLRLNGVDVFARGACWLSADLLSLGGDPVPSLTKARDAGMNMIRVAGQGVYESDAFYAACDRLGLMVWQDFMFAVFDYPVSDAAFEASVKREANEFLHRTRLSPCLTVLCGGSEAAQQASMFGLPKETWSSVLDAQWLPEAGKGFRPEVPYVRNSPSGGALPFVANEGVTHYYGVGAYLRPLDDARRAEVRFASECLGFANPIHGAPLPGDPEWDGRAPKDNGASWTFHDVREHYLSTLYREDAAALRASDPARYLKLSAEVAGEVMAATYAEWRREASSCHGALVWTFQDLWPCDGWGVVDAQGQSKPAFDHLRRAFQPRAVFLLDEGVNGLSIHVHNERPEPLTAKLSLSCLRDGRVAVAQAEREVTVPAHGSLALSAFELLGSFFDVSYAYRFGAPAHDVTVATLTAADGSVISEAFHFPNGRFGGPRPAANVKAACVRDAQGVVLELESDAFVGNVRVHGVAAEDGGFHLVPGKKKTVRLHPVSALSEGDVDAITLPAPIRFRTPA